MSEALGFQQIPQPRYSRLGHQVKVEVRRFYGIFVINTTRVAGALILRDCLLSPCALPVHEVVLEPLLFYEYNFKKGFYHSREVNSEPDPPTRGL